MGIRATDRRGRSGRILLIAMAGAWAPALEAQASGYQLREQSATAQGNAFAGAAAGGDDMSAMFFNPASMTQFTGDGAALHLSYIAPRVELDGAAASTVLGTPIAGNASDDNAAVTVLVPALYGMWQASEDWRVGLSVNVPFGLETDYSRDWVGRYQAVGSQVKTINVSPQVAWRATPWLSLGAGIQAQYIDATLSNAVDFGTIGRAAGISAAVPGSRSQDGFSEVQGDDWGYGYSLGAVAEPVDGTRIGLSYRSRVEHGLKGDAAFDLGSSGVGTALAAATGAFRDTGASAAVTTPASLSIGVRQRVSPEWTVMGGLEWTEWSVFDELRIEFDNAAQSDSVTREDWKDTWFASLGATYRPADSPWTFRAGVAYDQAPLDTGNRTPRIPDGDRYWLSAGASYQPTPWLSVTAAYTHLFVADAELDLGTSDTGSTFRGNLTGNYESSVDIVAVSARLLF
ncbi:outer membrane protein transport protein [Thalassobaculum sp.]|uniref:OmpP1/FadL family transporter n=1 Tax=Thalassobaculum sp. TaxID=2022740 RepID=UPI0032ED5B50